MENIGLDLHQRESQLCILTDDGEVIERRIRTTPERLRALLGGRPPARILLEASTESEWVARQLETLGHTVIVADPNFAPMYATRSGRVKTDRRDARTLADALRVEAYRPAHRSAEGHRHVRAELAVRETLVRTRTRYVGLLQALVRRDGLRAPERDAGAHRDQGRRRAGEPDAGERTRAPPRTAARAQCRDRRRRSAPGGGPGGQRRGAAPRDRARDRPGHRDRVRRHPGRYHALR